LKARGEDAAVAHLERCGMTVVDRRWSSDADCVDAIARDGDQLVLADVVTVRAGHQKGEQPVCAAVARRIRKVASAYIQANDLGDIKWRFDRISILAIAADRALLRHHRDALASGE